jgi:phosphoribosyl 1,2-cyclic phosphodiesterase
VILDAGTGLRLLGQYLLKEFPTGPLNLTLLLSHTHWDHIQGLPFFAPIYEKRCHLRILGCEGARKGLEEALTGQMETTYFPVPFAKLPSNILIEELTDYDLQLGSFQVKAHRANHPGVCVGYRLTTPDGRIAFFPDTEPRPEGPDAAMLEFIHAVDVLILDSQYDQAEYQHHVGWGHGCVDASVALALQAAVKHLFLFHHDPNHDDKTLDRFVRHARALVARKKGALKVDAAREGGTVTLRAPSPVKRRAKITLPA